MPKENDNQPEDLTEDQLQQMASDLDNEDFDPEGGEPKGGDDAGDTPAAGGQDGSEEGDGTEGDSTREESDQQSGKESGDDKDDAESKKEGSDEAKDKKPGEGGEEDPDDKEGESAEDESPYEKARQKREAERQRLNDSWKKLDTEKETVRSQEQQLKEREEELKQREEAAKKPRYGADDYDRLAERYDNEGSADMAEMARRKAKQLREEGEKTVDEQLKRERERRDEFVKQWRGNEQALQEKYPELKDRESEMYREGVKVLKEIPSLTWDPDGINHAAEIAKARISERKVEGLNEELGEAQKEIARLNKLLDPGESGPPQRGGRRDFESMSDKEQESFLQQAAAEADRGGF